MYYHAHGFVDGAYLRRLAADAHAQLVNPHQLVKNLVFSKDLQNWASVDTGVRTTALTRVTYYDAAPENRTQGNEQLEEYWKLVQLQPATQLGFGTLRGRSKRRPRRQKGVDTLIAVDMLVGAFTQLFSLAVLIAGDADFVPVVNEVRRRGVTVAVGAEEQSVADELRRAADFFLPIGPQREAYRFPPIGNDEEWKAR